MTARATTLRRARARLDSAEERTSAAREAFYEAVREHYEESRSLRATALVAGLSHGAVRLIVNA